MSGTTDSSYSSPFSPGLNMSENPEDLDFDFFNSNVPFAISSSQSPFPIEELTTDSDRDITVTGSQELVTLKDGSILQPPFPKVRTQTQSSSSSGSPAGSFQDSSSESFRYKRKASTDSSHSVLTSRDVLMAETDMGDWKVDEMMLGEGTGNYGAFDGTIDPSSINNTFGFNDKSMENDFDFDSAASSPSPFGAGAVGTEMPAIKHDTQKSSSELKARHKYHAKANSHFIAQSMRSPTTNGSREASPLSAVMTSQDSSPSAAFHSSPPPSMSFDFINGQILSNAPRDHAWPLNLEYHTSNAPVRSGLTPPSLINSAPSPLSSSHSIIDSTFKPTLTIHPTPLKSRVETQIPIKMTLFPIPPGVTKLHLPTHTISKPKLLARPPPDRSPDTLELYTTLVCTSAMQNPEYRRRAFSRAAATSLSESSHSDGSTDRTSDEEDESKPLNGGEVTICSGCIVRERKRAARKKVRKVEEEESWHKDERRRVIVFNTHEIKEWQSPSSQIASDTVGDRLEPQVPEGAMQVDAPMRIACYCRHQNEKLGFQVIFTIKDHNDNLIAQEMSSSIMITDDHKTHSVPPLSTQALNGSDGQLFPGPGIYSSESSFDLSVAPFRQSHSSSDLRTLQQDFSTSYLPPGGNVTSHSSQSTFASTTMIPRSLSRQASPPSAVGPNAKKRKASGSSKVPTGLAMTRLETNQFSSIPSASPASAATTALSPFTTSVGAFHSPQDGLVAHIPQTTSSIPQQYSTGPSTPSSNDHVFFSNVNRSHSMENLTMHQLYSAPASAHQSRAPSPNGLRNNAQNYQQAQIAQAVANTLYGMPLSLNPHRLPTIHKMIPNEGPKSGGIEVTCLGSGFCQGLEVMFGDIKATTTTYWGETSLVCLLPPAAFAGTVPVTFKHQHQQQQIQPYPPPPIPKQQIFFKYVDDDEQQLIRTALTILGHKMTGKAEDVRELARRIIGDGSSSWGTSMGHSPSGVGQHQQVSGLNTSTIDIDVEATLLKCLDLIDLDDSPNMSRLNFRRASGQTMLHLACALGLHRFVAALLARGVNPEPRDNGGFTPMHFAAMHNHPQIVRRLILCGADPTMRSLQGYTPSDLATSDEVLRSTRRIERHIRTHSGGSMRSRTSSATSLRSLWEQPSYLWPSVKSVNPEVLKRSLPSYTKQGSSTPSDDEYEYDAENTDTVGDDTFWMRSSSRRTSGQVPPLDNQAHPIELPVVGGGLSSPTAAVAALRDQLSAQIHHLQQTMQLNLPNLPQMPTLPMIANLPDYQAYLPTAPMVRRISSLVPHMGVSRPGTADHSTKDTDYKWWDLFSSTVSLAPPAYDDIFPRNDLDVKRPSATQAAADALADKKCAALFDQSVEATGSSTGPKSALLEALRIGQKHPVTIRGQQEQLRLAHAEKVKRLRSDRNLFFIWIPLLIVIILAMLYNRVPAVISGAQQLRTLAIRNNDRIIDV